MAKIIGFGAAPCFSGCSGFGAAPCFSGCSGFGADAPASPALALPPDLTPATKSDVAAAEAGLHTYLMWVMGGALVAALVADHFILRRGKFTANAARRGRRTAARKGLRRISSFRRRSAVNLDDPSDAEDWIKAHPRARGPQKQFASAKVLAGRARLRGDIRRALELERRAEAIYAAMPSRYRW